MSLSKKAAAMCATRLTNFFPSVAKQSDAERNALASSLIYLFENMDADAAKACLREYPLEFKFLTAYDVRQWHEKWMTRPSHRPQKSQVVVLDFDDGWAPPSEEDKERVRRKVAEFKAGVKGT